MKPLKWLAAIFAIQALLAAGWTFSTPSESGSAVLLWLSRERLLLLALMLLVSAAFLVIASLLWRSPPLGESLSARIEHFCLDRGHLIPVIAYLLVPPLLLLAAAFWVALTPLEYSAYQSWAPDTFPLLHSLVGALLPVFLLAALTALESAAYLAVRYRQQFRDGLFRSWHTEAPALLALLIGVVTVFYWLVLIFQLRFFVSNPAWYWKLQRVPFGIGDAWFVLISMLLIGLSYWALILQRRTVPGLLLLAMLGLFLQFGVGLMSGGGLASFRDRYFSTYHKTYISKAATGDVSILDGIRNYEELYGRRQFTNTKPPGLMVAYNELDHMLNGHPPRFTDAARFERLSNVITYSFPVAAMLLVFALYGFAQRYVPGQVGLLPQLASFLLVLCPNLILFSLFPDQAVYPLVFMLGTAFIIVVIQRQSIVLAFLLGLFLYLAVFFAFTMLPLYPFAVIYLALNYWSRRRELPWRRQVWLALAIAAATLLLYMLFRTLLQYDFLPRFAQAVSINHNFDFYLRVGRTPPGAAESFSTRVLQVIGAAWLNHLDLAAAMGFPLYVLFVAGGLRLLVRLFRGASRSGDIILAALLMSFLVLNLAGTAQGEVPRLWLFWLPMMVMLAAMELEPYIAEHPRLLLLLSFLQLVTVFLTFHFQDLRM